MHVVKVMEVEISKALQPVIEFNVEKIHPYFGAIVHDIDVNRLSSDDIHALEDLLIQHKVLFIRGQQLSSAQHVKFAEHFGKFHLHQVFDLDKNFPELVEFEYDENRKGKNDTWHSDVTFIDTPVKYGILYSLDTPKIGGDTLWLDTEAAYQALSTPIQKLIQDLSAYHTFFDGVQLTYKRKDGSYTESINFLKDITPALHPVVRHHPITQKPSIYVNQAFTKKIKDLSRVESDAILKLLLSHLEHPEFQLRWRWQTGDLVLWDNRSTQHLAVSDYFPAHRHVRRAAILGEKVH